MFWMVVNASADCEYKADDNGSYDVLEALDKCATGTKALDTWTGKSLTAEKWFKNLIGQITQNLMYIFWVIAIWAIAYGWLTLTLSAWNDDKIKKWKDLIKWASLGFLVIISAWWIITIIVKVIYWLAWGK